MRDLALAASTLTALPLKARWPQGEKTDVAGYYPVVGLALGAAAFFAVRVLALMGWDGRGSLGAATLLVASQAVVTRMLHWDGLADVGDAFWAYGSARRLEIMSDSSVGAFGVTALVLGLLLHVAGTERLLVGRGAIMLVAVPVFGRLGATFGAWFGKPARTDGLGASVAGRPGVGAVVPALCAVALAASVLLLGLDPMRAALLTGAGVLLAGVVPHSLSSRFGGVTGDVLGASVVVVEALLLAVTGMWW